MENKYKKKRTYKEIIKSMNVLEKEIEYKIKSLSIPKLENYNFLETNLIDMAEAKKINLLNSMENLYHNIETNSINIYITKLDNFKVNIPNNYFIVTDITKDGNCFFRSVSKYLSGEEKYHLFLRKIAYNYIKKNKNTIITKNENNLIYKENKFYNLDEYLKELSEDGNYSGELEFYAISQIFNIAIYVYEFDNNLKSYRFLYKYNINNETFQYCMIINHTYTENNCEHYELLKVNQLSFDINFLNSYEYIKNNLPHIKKEVSKNIEINKNSNISNNYDYINRIKNNNDKNIKNKKITKLKTLNNEINKNKDEIVSMKENTIIYNDNDNNNASIEEEYLENISKKESLNDILDINNISHESNEDILIDEFKIEHIQIKNIILDNELNNSEKIKNLISLCDKIIYPKYYNYYNGDDYYRDKMKYLLSAKIDNKFRLYPEFITEEDDYILKENKKRYFRNSIINYSLNSDYKLCFLHTKKEKKEQINSRRSNNRHKKKYQDEIELYTIPTVKNVIQVLEKIHASIMHQGFLKMKDKIDEIKIFYHGINQDILEFPNLCEICAQKNIQYYKRSPCKQIIFNKPKERVVLDLTYLPLMLLKNTEFKYMLNCIDHFSKYVVSYLIKQKTGKVITEKLKHFFRKFGEPKEIGTDNGSEFNNKFVKKLLDSKGIKHIKGKPYNPHSQGIVERVHRTLRNGLVCKYLEDKEKFSLNNSLNFVVNSYNNIKHRATRFKPNDIYFSEDEQLFKIVKENTLKFSKNYFNDEDLFDINDPILLYNNFEREFSKKNNFYILNKAKIKRKKVLYNICGSIKRRYDKDQYIILIETNYKDYELKKFDQCLVKTNLIKKVNYDTWFNILNK